MLAIIVVLLLLTTYSCCQPQEITHCLRMTAHSPLSINKAISGSSLDISFWSSASSTKTPTYVALCSLYTLWIPRFWLAEVSKLKVASKEEPKGVAHQIRWGPASLLGSWPPPTPPPGSAPRFGPACPHGEPGTAMCFAGTGWGCDKVSSLLFLLQPLRECYTLRCLVRVRKNNQAQKITMTQILQMTSNIIASQI